jgi:hypothetical protein
VGETRPATILSEHGEGYCRVCRFVVGLDEFGRLQSHRPGSSMDDRYSHQEAPRCKGTGRLPAKITPVTSTKSAFKAEPVKVTCHVCGKAVGVDVHLSLTGRSTYKDHRSPDRKRCTASWTPVR